MSELMRRNVVRVGVAYVVVGWLVTQVAETLLPGFDTPPWVFRTLVVLIVLGLPLALVFAWAFELTPDGIRKTRDVDLAASVTRNTGRKLDFVIIGALVIALGYFLWERQGLIEASRDVAKTEPEAPAAAPMPSVAEPRSIAVLPFLNMSDEDSQEWFADGLTEELLNSLVRTPDLLVASRTSSFAYKNTAKAVPAIAAELGVDHILEGSVRRSGERLRVTAQLIRAADGFHLWSETYDRRVDDVIELQEEVAVEIARALETAMDPEALDAMMKVGTRSVPAYEAYLKGLAHGVSMQMEGDVYEFLDAREAFEGAVQIDPQFAEAWAELGAFWNIQLDSTLIVAGITGLDEREMLNRQSMAFDRAIAAAKDPVAALRYRAERAAPTLDFDLRRRLIEEYLQHRPNDINAQIAHLVVLDSSRRFDEALRVGLAYIDRGSEDPIIKSLTLQSLRYSNDRSLQREVVQRITQRHPDNVNLAYQAHRVLLYAGDLDGASRLVPFIDNSILPQSSRLLVQLRQACAENRIADALALLDTYRATREVRAEEDRSTEWLAFEILGDRESAYALLEPLDNEQGVGELRDYLGYGHFDARRFPYLVRRLAGQDLKLDQIYDLPYRCQSGTRPASS